MAVAIDVGEWNDIHPLNKQEIGKRLALWANKLVYNPDTAIFSGPLFKSAKAEGSKVIVRFTNVGKGLAAREGDSVRYFSIAGADNKYVWAQVIIKGNMLIVWSDKIARPVSIRYAWADNPDAANLENKEGLPASPFEARINQ